jgi:hypothetical protein
MPIGRMVIRPAFALFAVQEPLDHRPQRRDQIVAGVVARPVGPRAPVELVNPIQRRRWQITRPDGVRAVQQIHIPSNFARLRAETARHRPTTRPARIVKMPHARIAVHFVGGTLRGSLLVVGQHVDPHVTHADRRAGKIADNRLLYRPGTFQALNSSGRNQRQHMQHIQRVNVILERLQRVGQRNQVGMGLVAHGYWTVNALSLRLLPASLSVPAGVSVTWT